MDNKYSIGNTHNFNMSKWREHVKAIQLDATIGLNITAYIVQHYLGLGLDAAPQWVKQLAV